MRTRRLIPIAVAALLAAAAAVTPAGAHPAGTATATFATVSDWGTGFEGKITVTNGSSGQLDGWTVEFELPAGFTITSSWDARRTSSGTHHTFANPTWAPVLAPGASTTFGFNGSPGGLTAIQNCRS